jgi:hypothetical protein
MASATTQLVLLLAVVHDPSDRVVTRAAAEALVTPFVEAPALVVREAVHTPGPKPLAALLGESTAQAAVVIACETAGCARVTLTVLRDDAQSFTRTLRFGPRDALPERGRAVGLLASTLLPEKWSRHLDQAAAAPPTTVAAPTAQPGAPPPRWTAQAGLVYFVPTAVVRADVALLASLRRRFGGGWEAGATARVERGGLEMEPGDFLGAAAGLTGAWLSPGWQERGRFGFGARLDLLAIRRQLRHDEVIQIELHDYWALGADVAALAGYGVTNAFTLVAAVGIESIPFAFGDEEHTRAAERLSDERVHLELGLTGRF